MDPLFHFRRPDSLLLPRFWQYVKDSRVNRGQRADIDGRGFEFIPVGGSVPGRYTISECGFRIAEREEVSMASAISIRYSEIRGPTLSWPAESKLAAERADR